MKVIVIGLDGATFSIIRPLVKEGKLPTFKKLMESGAHGGLKSTLPTTTPPAWTSSITGKNPGKHNLFQFWVPKKDYSLDICNSTTKRSAELWDLIKGRSIVINLPFSYPARKINGIMITGMLTPSMKSKGFTEPPEIAEWIRENEPEYKLALNWSLYKGKEKEFEEDLKAMIESRARVIKKLMKEKEFDLLFAVFVATDRLQHLLWENKGAIERCYIQLDSVISDIMKEAGDLPIVILSDHGFAPLKGTFNINTWLESEGYLKVRKSAKTRLLAALKLDRETAKSIAVKTGLVRVMSRDRLRKIKNRLPAEAGACSIGDIDWGRTKAFSVDIDGLVYINSEGRFDKGIVPESEYSALKKEIIGKLSKVRTPGGAPLAISVHAREEVYSGEFMKNGPDIIIEPSEGITFSTPVREELWSKAEGAEKAKHAREGIFLAYGNGIKKTSVNDARIEDVAPTILCLLGEKIPKDMDGRVLSEILNEPAKAGYYEKEDITQKIDF